MTSWFQIVNLNAVANIVDDLKNALSSVVSGAGDVLSTTREVARDNVVGILQAGGDVASNSISTLSTVTNDGVKALSETGTSVTEGVTGLVEGVVEGAQQVGGDVGGAALEASKGAVRGSSDVGADVGEVAVAAVEGAIKAAGTIGGDSGSLVKSAVIGTLQAADEVGSESGSLVRKALLNTAALPHDIIDALLTGKTE